MSQPESKLDQLLRQRAEIDDALRRHQTAFSVLFTDVVGSTSYFEKYGDIDGMAMLSRHETLARKCVEEQGGRVIKNIGDSVMAEFPDAAAAARAAVEIQRRLLRLNQTLPERERLQIRIGINHGTGFRHEGDVFGDVVNVAARITKKTGPAQILVGASVKDAVVKKGDFRCNFVGKVEMKGKAEEGEVFEVVWTDTHTYVGLRQNVTVALKRGDLVAPGLDPNELLQSTPPPPLPEPPAADTGFLTPIPVSLEARYEIMSELGRGGMGIVYKARDRETNDLVALKVLREEVAADAKGMQRFKNELRVARRITHKNICRIHEFSRTENTAYISMEFVEGESLRHLLNRFGSLGLRKGIEVALQICAGLREAHAQGVVHRDLKPENVMIDAAGNVKVMDFGIAHAPIGAGLTQTNAVVGTPTYMAPEQAEGKKIDHRVDIYALGLILYEIFTGSPTFTAETPFAVAIKHMTERPLPPRELDASIPEEVNFAILKCLEKDPAARFQSVDELATALTGQSITLGLEGMAPMAGRTGEVAPVVAPSQPTPMPSGAYHQATPYGGSPLPSPLPPQGAAPQSAPPSVATAQVSAATQAMPVPVVAPAPPERAGMRTGMIVGAVLAVGVLAAFVLMKFVIAPSRIAGRGDAPAVQVQQQPPAQTPSTAPAEPQTAAQPRNAAPPASTESAPPAAPRSAAQPPASASAEPAKPVPAEPAPPPPVAKVSVEFSLVRTLAGHTGAVSSVSFSGNGRMVVTGSRDKTARVWEAGTGRLVRTLKGHKDAVTAVAFNPEGTVVASGSMDRTIIIWDAGSGQPIVTLPKETGFVNSVEFSPDGQALAAALSDGRIKMWDVSSGQGIQSLDGHSGAVFSLAFSPDGRWLASGGRDQTVRLWNIGSGQQAREFRGHSDAVNTVAFSPDGRWLASASDDKTVKLWDVASGSELRTFTGHTGAADGLAFSPDGRWLAAGSEDKTVLVWNTATGEELKSLTGHIYAITELAITRNGRLLASAAGDNAVRLWRRE